MSEIQWTDETWNPTTGCTKISPGCLHCYIERTPPMRMAGRKFVGGKIPLEMHADRLDKPLHWKKPRRVFVNSMSDLFHEDVPFKFIDHVMATMLLAAEHTFQVLTKRAARMAEYFASRSIGDIVADANAECDRIDRETPANAIAEYGTFGRLASQYRIDDVFSGTRQSATSDRYYEPSQPRNPQAWPLSNVWLGVSCEDQKRADERIPLLLQTPAAVRFLSCEPLLGAIDIAKYLCCESCLHPAVCWCGDAKVSWVIVGGESGPNSRPCNVEWIRDIARQCKAAGVPCFVKQLGSKPMYERPAVEAGRQEVYVDGLKDKKGGDIGEWPEDLRVREFPTPPLGVPA